MAAYLVRIIMKEAEKSIEKGQAKYRALFIRINVYAKYKDDTDAILITEGYEDCIVTE